MTKQNENMLWIGAAIVAAYLLYKEYMPHPVAAVPGAAAATLMPGASNPIFDQLAPRQTSPIEQPIQAAPAPVTATIIPMFSGPTRLLDDPLLKTTQVMPNDSKTTYFHPGLFEM